MNISWNEKKLAAAITFAWFFVVVAARSIKWKGDLEVVESQLDTVRKESAKLCKTLYEVKP